MVANLQFGRTCEIIWKIIENFIYSFFGQLYFKMIAICIIIALICANAQADVSHLVHGNDQFNGYNYEPPSNPLPLPTTFRPEIIVNKGSICFISSKCFLLQIKPMF